MDALNAVAASLSRDSEVGNSGLVAPADGDITKRSSLLSMAGSRNIGEAGGLSNDLSSSRNSGLTNSLGSGGFNSGSGISSLSSGLGSGRSSGGLSSLTGSLSSGRSIGSLSSGRSSGLSSSGLGGGGGLGNYPSRSLIGSTAGNWPRGRSLSLSIDASMKVLRQALLFKSAQLRQQQQMSRARQNHEYLQTIGKRSAPSLQEDTDDER